MLNIRAFLLNIRTSRDYPVKNVPTELAKLQIKGQFNIKFPFGFNRGISTEKIKFVKYERQLLLNDYEIYGASANWVLSVFFGNLSQPLRLILDFTDICYDDVFFEIGFKATPLLDKIRNFEKYNEKINFTPPQYYQLKAVVPQEIDANFRINQLTVNTVTIAGIKSDGLIDANGLEYNVNIPDKNQAIALFRIIRKETGQQDLFFNLDIKFKDLKIRMWQLNGTIKLKLRTDYLFFYTDGTHEYYNLKQDIISSSVLYTVGTIRNFRTSPKRISYSNLPSDPNKTLSDAFLTTYLQVDAPQAILINGILITCDKIHISHNYIQIDEIYRGVRVSNYLQKVNELAGTPIFESSLLHSLDDYVITSTNYMVGNSNFLAGKLMDLLESLSIVRGFSFIEIDNKYVVSTIAITPYFSGELEITNYKLSNYEPIEQFINFEIGSNTDVPLKIIPRLFDFRNYYLNVDTLATLDALSIITKLIISNEVIINNLMSKKYDDNLILLKIEQQNYGDFGITLNEQFSNKNIINRLLPLLNSFFTTSVSSLYYRDEKNNIITHNISNTSRLFGKFYLNIIAPANNELIAALLNSYKRIKIGNKRYLPVEYSLNLEPNSINIKLLELIV